VDVSRAINDFYVRNAAHLIDCGYVTREITAQPVAGETKGEPWCGFRLMRYVI